jgi:hypothetical protein
VIADHAQQYTINVMINKLESGNEHWPRSMQLDRFQDFDAIIEHKEDTMRNVKWPVGFLALLIEIVE